MPAEGAAPDRVTNGYDGSICLAPSPRRGGTTNGKAPDLSGADPDASSVRGFWSGSARLEGEADLRIY